MKHYIFDLSRISKDQVRVFLNRKAQDKLTGGIYLWVNQTNGHFYVGSTINFYNRIMGYFYLSGAYVTHYRLMSIFPPYLHQVAIGLLLSDGSIERPTRTGGARLSVILGINSLPYLLHLYNLF